ncbi:hypothetical protein RJ641_000174 [Dillenia turbinata]|uniref:Uncharacterized protein n=1 Tax=Dillenia turbinata TaxID=194707 RepID=A0AAN8WDE2_9MAGN
MEFSKWSWKNILDMKEAKGQVLYALPMVVTNVCYYSIPVVSVMFASHLGHLELAGSTLANSWASVTGFCVMVIPRAEEGLKISLIVLSYGGWNALGRAGLSPTY